MPTPRKKHLFRGSRVGIFYLSRCVSTPKEELMDRTIVSAAVLLAGLLVAMPTQAQRLVAQDRVWNSDRPDGHAPAGVKADFTLARGDIYVGYRHTKERF